MLASFLFRPSLNEAGPDRLSSIRPSNVCGLRDLLGLEADALERAEGLPHGRDLFVAGLALALRLLEGVGELVEASDGVAEVAAQDLDLRQGSFERGLFRRRGRVGFADPGG